MDPARAAEQEQAFRQWLELEHEAQIEWRRERVELLRSAFHKAGVEYSEEELFRLFDIQEKAATLPPTRKYQEAESRRRVLKVRTAAETLLEHLEAAYDTRELGDMAYTGCNHDFYVREKNKLNVCDELFFGLSINDLVERLHHVIYKAGAALAMGVSPGRGRPRRMGYDDFIQALHHEYFCRKKKKGYYQKEGRAYGAFVDLVIEAQSLLPPQLRMHAPEAIATRVYEALKPKTGRIKPVPRGRTS
jgi:hypothetical protein